MFITRNDIAHVIDNSMLIQLTSDDGSAESPNETRINDIIDYTNNLIADHLRGRYVLPLVPVPEPLIEIGRRIALYKLHELRHSIINETVRDGYKSAMQMLLNYSNGKGVQLDVDSDKPPVRIVTYSPDESFSDDILDLY